MAIARSGNSFTPEANQWKRDVVQKTMEYIREKSEGEESGHDWWHTSRVRRLAVHIGKRENADLFVVELAALLHDVADWKFNNGDDSAGSRVARVWLESLNVEPEVISHVCDIIHQVSFKGAGEPSRMNTLEGKVVQDADRLDAIGAIGIARAFAYGGYRGREIHNPHIPPGHNETFEQYKNSNGTTINHFYEKLLLLNERMNTQTACRMAEERHKFMEEYLDRFFREWEGKV